MFRPLAALAGAILLAAGAPALAQDLPSLLATAMAGSKVPAMGVLVMRDGRTAGEAVRGVRRNDASAAVTTDDVWHIGSDGKAMTVAMVARLADRGVLSWTAPLEVMLPDLAASMRPEYRRVTLVQLLSHHAGLPENIVDEKALNALLTARSTAPLPRQRLAYVTRAVQDAPVGPTSAFSYSNSGLLIAGVIAERAAGQPFEALMRQEVFAPLGMSHAAFGLPPGGQPSGHVGGRPALPADENPDFFAPAGNLYMPLDDWARFCLDQLAGARGQGRLLKPGTYALMQTAQPGGSAGLGWGVQPTIAGRKGPALVHAGSDGAWYALVALLPATGSGVLVTANAGEGMGGDAAGKQVFKSVIDTLSPPAP